MDINSFTEQPLNSTVEIPPQENTSPLKLSSQPGSPSLIISNTNSEKKSSITLEKKFSLPPFSDKDSVSLSYEKSSQLRMKLAQKLSSFLIESGEVNAAQSVLAVIQEALNEAKRLYLLYYAPGALHARVNSTALAQSGVALSELVGSSALGTLLPSSALQAPYSASRSASYPVTYPEVKSASYPVTYPEVKSGSYPGVSSFKKENGEDATALEQSPVALSELNSLSKSVTSTEEAFPRKEIEEIFLKINHLASQALS